MKKTVTSLNKKSWYRLLKVVYIFALVGSLFAGILSIWYEIEIFEKVIDDNKTEIVCKYDNQKTFNAKNNEVYLDIKNKKINDFNFNKIVELCEINNIFNKMDSDQVNVVKNNVQNDSVNKESRDGSSYFDLEKGKEEQIQNSIRFSQMERENRQIEQRMRKVDVGENFIGNEYYGLSFVTENKGGFFVFLGYLILSVIGIFIVFEIIKRTFYYIVLGSINPEK